MLKKTVDWLTVSSIYMVENCNRSNGTFQFKVKYCSMNSFWKRKNTSQVLYFKGKSII